MNFIEAEKLYTFLLKIGATINLQVININPIILFWMNFSCIAILVASVSSLKGKSSDFIYFTERINDFLIMAGLVFFFATLVAQEENVTFYAKNLLRPFPNYSLNSAHSKIVETFKTRVIYWGIFIYGFFISSLFSMLLYPWLKCITAQVYKATGHRAPPIGEVPWSQKSDVVFWSWYLVSATSLGTSILLYACLLFTFIYSSLHITTKLKVLALDLISLDVRAESMLENALGNRTVPKGERKMLLTKCIDKLLKKIIAEHTEIIRQVSLTEKTFRWVALYHYQAAILVSALYVTIIINSESLRRALYNMNWTDKPTYFTRNLVIMMTVAKKPLRLTAGSIFPLNRETYKKIVEGVFSYINFLVQIKK